MQALAPRCPRCSRSSQRTRCQRASCSHCPCQSSNPEVEGDDDIGQLDIDDIIGVEEALIEWSASDELLSGGGQCGVELEYICNRSAFEGGGGETLDWEPEDIHTDPSLSTTSSQFLRLEIHFSISTNTFNNLNKYPSHFRFVISQFGKIYFTIGSGAGGYSHGSVSLNHLSSIQEMQFFNINKYV